MYAVYNTPSGVWGHTVCETDMSAGKDINSHCKLRKIAKNSLTSIPVRFITKWINENLGFRALELHIMIYVFN